MFFGLSDRVAPILSKLRIFINEIVIPNEARYLEELSHNRWQQPTVMESMKQRAKDESLFNLFLNSKTQAFNQVEYAHLAELMGRTEMAAEVFNCASPDTGNMEVLARFGSKTQQETWLAPLLSGEIRSGFAMTEPDVASSDLTNIASSARLDGDHWIVDGEKSWVSGAGDANCKLLVVMCVTNPDGALDKRQSTIIVPMATEGVEITRMVSVFGYDDAPHGHAQIRFNKVRVPRQNIIGKPGQGFEIAQGRLGSGRIHHCMRSIGAAERALELMVKRSTTRYAFGKPLSELGGNVDVIANSRIEIEMSRLMALKAAYQLDTVGLEKSLNDIAQMKVAVPNMTLNVIDRAIQMFGGMGVSEDTPLAKMWAAHRALRLSDGPDEVHREMISRHEMGKFTNTYV
ncbi:MAG: acyl-CoA dehydrogenase family protein [bacterium]|nr:acyl-CoA dehydrogenase [Gammaproteobacteria bacterium]HIL96872.1 acyl-CoA dehydrogenase [Pseudomonadales bacterium]